MRVGQLRDDHLALAPLEVPDSTKTPCSASRLARPPRGSSAKGLPCRSRVTLRSMVVPIASHSATKSRIVHRWILGVSYQELFKSSDTGIRPRHDRLRRMRQKPKFGKETIARLPMRTRAPTTS